jgi:hypothetical protein
VTVRAGQVLAEFCAAAGYANAVSAIAAASRLIVLRMIASHCWADLPPPCVRVALFFDRAFDELGG